MKKRFFAAALCAVIALTLLPATAFAAGTGTIQLGAGGIIKGGKVYFGQYGAEEVQWIALDNDGFLLSQYTIGRARFRDCRYYYESPGPQKPGYYGEDWDNDVEDSTLKLSMDGLYNGEGTTLFTVPEQGAVAATILTGESMDYDGYVRPLTVYLYPLSLMEIYDYTAREYVIDEALLVTGDITDKINGNEYGWWTRTNDSPTHVVRVGGRDAAGPLTDEIRESLAIRGVRPAFHLNRDSVLFASAAAGGKSVAGMGAGLTAVPANTPAEWKLTLKDSSHSRFSIVTTDLSSTSATVNYTGAQTGTNEYISAMIVRGDNNVLYYGRIKSLPNAADASGEVTISIPAGVTLDTGTTLKVFNEQFNGDRASPDRTHSSRAYTDYASAFKTVTTPLVITDPVAPQNIPVTLGSPLTLSVTATGAIAYQWYYKPNGSASFAPINNATGASCTTPPITPDNIGDQYYCVVTGGDSTATSPIFTLQIAGSGGDTGGDAGADVPETGDNTPILAFIGIVALCGVGLLARRKRSA